MPFSSESYVLLDFLKSAALPRFLRFRFMLLAGQLHIVVFAPLTIFPLDRRVYVAGPIEIYA